jgi:hypothetical protein
MERIDLYKLYWASNIINDGLWNNGGLIAIHWPLFQESFSIVFTDDTVDTFYVNYSDDDYIEKMSISYVKLNDIVFKQNVYRGCNKARIFTTIVPNCK